MGETKESVVVPAQQGYDLWAEIYDREVNPLILLETEHVQPMLGVVAGLRILDLGCGTGRHSLALSRAGAEVTGVDFSRGMLDQARAKPGADRVRFVHHDIAGHLPFADAEFDRVVCALALEHVRDLRTVFGEMHRLVKPEGRIIISEMHPAMWLRGVSAHFDDPKTGHEIRPLSVGNQISDYLMAAVQFGLTIESIAEFAIDEALAKRAPRCAKHLGWPLLLLMTFKP